MNCTFKVGFLLTFLFVSSFAKAYETPATLVTNSGNIQGKLRMPDRLSKSVCVLIIAGSGPTDGDGNSALGLTCNAYKLIAEQLEAAGYASLRYDKRGIGESRAAMKSEADLRFEDYVNDAKGWLQYLRDDGRFEKIIIAGHSEGSLIGMIAAQGADAFISISGAGEGAGPLLDKQLKENFDKKTYKEAHKVMLNLQAGKTVECKNPTLMMIFHASVQPYLISWFKYDPQVEIAKLKIPILIAQGDRDLQVSMHDAENLHAAAPTAVFVSVHGMNHVLKWVPETKEENLASYNNPDLPVSEPLIAAINEFISSL